MTSERDHLAEILMSDAVMRANTMGRDYALTEADAILASEWLTKVKREAAAEALEQFATRCDGVPAVKRELQRQADEYRKENT